MSESQRIDRVEGRGIPLRGNDIDTDRIIPARFLKAITFDGLGGHVFEDDRRALKDHPFADPRFEGATILLVNENFGSGSSREHAPQGLKRWGIDACIGESFSEIFRGNSLAIGLPCATADHMDLESTMRCVEDVPDARLRVSVSALTLQILDRTISLEMSSGMRDALLNGQWDATGLLLDRFEQVRAVADNLPYLNGF